MTDPGFLTTDRTGAQVNLATAKLIDETLRELFGEDIASPAANTIGARLVSMLLALGTPSDAATVSSLIGLLKALSTVNGASTDAAGAASQIGQLKSQTIAIGSPSDAAWDGLTANPSLIAMTKRQIALLSDPTAAKVDTVVSGAATNRSAIIGWTGVAAAATTSSTTLTATVSFGVPTVGDTIGGTGITAGTTITAVTGTAPNYTLTLSAAATVASGASVFSTLAKRQLMAAKADRRFISLRPQSATGDIYMSGVADATIDQNSLLIKAQEYYESSPVHVGTGAISVITAASGGVMVYAREA